MKKIKSEYIIAVLVVLLESLIISCNSFSATEHLVTVTKISEVSTHISVTPTIVPSQTISPTLSSTQTAEFIGSLYTNNGGCEFPCWWGIMPGRDTLQSVYDRLSPFGVFKDNTRRGDILPLISFATIPPKEIDLFSEGEWSFNMRVKDDIVESITTSSVNTRLFATPTLDTLLRNLGAPEEIWVMIVPRMDGAPYYGIVLFYPKKGTLVGWNGTTQVLSERDNGITVTICPQNMDKEIDMIAYLPPYFHFWSPNENKSFAEINSTQLFKEPYRLLTDQNSDIKADGFYETYLDSQASKCFQFSYP